MGWFLENPNHGYFYNQHSHRLVHTCRKSPPLNLFVFVIAVKWKAINSYRLHCKGKKVMLWLCPIVLELFAEETNSYHFPCLTLNSCFKMNRAIFIRDSKDKHVFKVIKTIGYSWSKFRPSNPIEKLLIYRYPGLTEGKIPQAPAICFLYPRRQIAGACVEYTIDSRTRSGEGSG